MLETEKKPNFFEDDLLNGLLVSYESVYISKLNGRIKDIECDDSGKMMAFVEHDGNVTIWENYEDEWLKRAVWKYKAPQRHRYITTKFSHNQPLKTTFRPNVIARWCNTHGRYLGIASDVSKKIHLFGENTEPPPFDMSEKPIAWHRKHTMISAGHVTEMRFSPAHVEFTLVTATQNGMVVVHMLQDKQNIKSWRPIHAISVFRNQPINSLSWNQNPVHELPILIASTDSLDAEEGKQVAVFAINSPSVRPNTNMCFENVNQVSCVSFAPSTGLNDSLLAVAAGRRIMLYLMNVEEFQVPQDEEEQFTPSLASESDDFSNHENGSGSGSAISRSIEIDRLSGPSTPASNTSHLNSNQNTSSTISSPMLPSDFFSSLEDLKPSRRYRDEFDSDSVDDGNSSEEEEKEQEPTDARKALMWNVKWIAVFRESCAIKKIQWGRNADNFTAHLIDGRIQGYKWSYGCLWARSTVLHTSQLEDAQNEDE